MKWVLMLALCAAFCVGQARFTQEVNYAQIDYLPAVQGPGLAILATDARFLEVIGIDVPANDGLFEYIAVAVDVGGPIVGGQVFLHHDGVLDSIQVAPDFGLEIIEITVQGQAYTTPPDSDIQYAWGTEFGETPPQGTFVPCFVMNFTVPPCFIEFDLAANPPTTLTAGDGDSIPVELFGWDCNVDFFVDLSTTRR